MKKKPSKVDRVEALFRKNLGRWVSSFKVEQAAPLSRTQTVTRVRARKYVVDFTPRTRRDGTVEHGYLVVAVPL